MADVTIGNLPPGIALGQCFVPLSDTVATVKARVSALQVDYSNITSKPTIPAAQVNSDWNASSGVAQILNKPTIPTIVGFSAIVSLATVGAGTWAKPAGITCIKVTVVGAGGGGGGPNFQGTTALAGGASVFDTAGINVTGNGGGAASGIGTRGVGGTGANGGVNITGAAGFPGGNGGSGGSWGGGGPGLGQYGVGGYGLVNGNTTYAGGGAGGIAIKYMTITSAATNYLYTIGAGGRGSSGGSAGNAAAGNSGIIIIEY